MAGDDLNPDNIGFGVKNGQASQINQNEGFFFHTDTNAAQQNLTFDVAGIGNVASMNYEVWMYDSTGHLVDYHTGVAANLKTANAHVTVSDLGLAGSTTPDHSAAGESFDSAYIHFYLDNPTSTAGVRIINFASQISSPTHDRLIDFQLANTDGDQDYALSNVFSVFVDSSGYTSTADHYTTLI